MASIRRKRRRRQRAPRSLQEFDALPQRSQDAWNLAAHVISEMRSHNTPLYPAAEKFGIDPRKVKLLGGSALRRRPNGRYAAKASDQLVRVVRIPEYGGLREIVTRGSRETTRLSKYYEAVDLFLDTGDSSSLEEFKGQTITTAQGERVPFLTDLDELERLGAAGVLSFESLYARAS
jgi:hypothetical protein